MKLLHGIVYGFLYGFAELFPVSGSASSQLLRYIFGLEGATPLLDLLVHIGILAAVVVCNLSALNRLRRDQRLNRRIARKRNTDMRSLYQFRIVRTASVFMILGLLLYRYFAPQELNLILLVFTCIVNGILLLAADHMRQGNKDARSLSAFDSVFIGLACAISAIPGISRVGMALCTAISRGADKTNSYNWALFISIPALVLFACFDILTIFTAGIGTISLWILVFCVVTAVTAFAGAYAAVSFMRYMLVRTGISGAAYYSFGISVFSFILYLIT